MEKEIISEKQVLEVGETRSYSHVRLTLCQTHKVDGLNESIYFINKVCKRILGKANELKLKIKGPIRLPTKKLAITTRKTPCGEGSKTWDHYRMEIHKWFFDVYCTAEDVRDLVAFQSSQGVTVDISIMGSDLPIKKHSAEKTGKLVDVNV